MRQTAFTYVVGAKLTLSKAEADHLSGLAARHYDRHCRLSAQQGGFIYGWLNMFEDGAAPGDFIVVLASFGELDTAAKILELPGANSQLGGEIVAVLGRLRAESERMNGEEDRHFVKPPKVVHRGHMYERTVGDFAQAKRESAFAAQWEEENRKDDLLAKLMNTHLQRDGLAASLKSAVWPTQRDASLAATVVQWLGSHVGFGFLEDALRRADLWVIGLREAAELKGHKLEEAGGDSVQCPVCRMLWPTLRGVVDASPCVVLQKLEIADRD